VLGDKHVSVTGQRGADGAVTDTCATWPTLRAWLENDLPDEESQLLKTHGASCDKCREKFGIDEY